MILNIVSLNSGHRIIVDIPSGAHEVLIHTDMYEMGNICLIETISKIKPVMISNTRTVIYKT